MLFRHTFWGVLLGVCLSWQLWGRWMPLAITRDLFLWGTMGQSSARESDVVFVTVGDEDLSRFAAREALFVDRRVYARVIDRLVTHGVSAIVFDLLFDHPTPLEASADQVLAQSIERSRRVVLARCLVKNPGASVSSLLEPIPLFASKAASMGYVNVNADPDGIIRTVKLSASHRGKLIHHIALEAIIQARKTNPPRVVEEGLVLEGSRSEESLFIPTGSDGRSIVNFSSIPDIPRVPIRELLEPKDRAGFHRALFSGKIVIIGSVSPLLKDRHAYLKNWLTEEKRLEDGAWFITVFLENILSRAFLKNITPSPGFGLALGFVLLALVFAHRPTLQGAGIVVGLSILSWLAAVVLYDQRMILDAFGITLSLGVLYTCPAVVRLTAEKVRLARLTKELSHEIVQVRRELERASEGDKGQKLGQIPDYLDRTFVTRFLPSRYQDLTHLGQGGMGVVFKGYDQELKICVAIKVLSPLIQDNPNSVKRFLLEGRTLKRLTHPGLPKVVDIQQSPLSFFAMEYVDGIPLDMLLSDRAVLSLARALEISRRVALVLGYVHEKGMIHRDIKPSNIMVLADDTVKLLDFGLVHDDDVTAITQSGDVLGTLKYMPPEQFAGSKCTAASDVYSLGVVICQLLTGDVPARQGYLHESPVELLRAHSVPPSVIELLDKCLSLYPDWRPKDGIALAAAIDEAKTRL